MHKVIFHPIGNADCCMIELDCGKRLLFDFANYEVSEDDKKINLESSLRERLPGDYFDVVAFTHADDDHVHGAEDFFYLEHAKKYQDDERIKIKELWVPAAMILEGNLKNSARVLRAEARHRLKEGKGIRVFSRPEKLKGWLEGEGIKLEERQHLITGAGKIVPGFSKLNQGVEFFVHSPFSEEADGKKIDRNEASLILHATFAYKERETNFLLIGDTTHEILEKIVGITKSKNNEARLKWDIYSIPHHCSYLALSSEKGEKRTEPVENVKWLLEQGKKYGKLIASSNVIPDDDESNDPPHRQAAKCYKKYADNIKGEFKVTMECPNKRKPEPLCIEIGENGASIKRSYNIAAGSGAAYRETPRAGKGHGIF